MGCVSLPSNGMLGSSLAVSSSSLSSLESTSSALPESLVSGACLPALDLFSTKPYTLLKIRQVTLYITFGKTYSLCISDVEKDGNNNTHYDVSKEKDHDVRPVSVWYRSLCFSKCVS